ncbi:MAG: primosomal protein N' [Phycisphaerales bacterium]|nr:primosomal protein N' [Phycisphaerales bacterium]
MKDQKKAQLWLLGKEGERRLEWVADVAPRLGGRKTYAYGIPDELRERARVGTLVRAPYGRSGRLIDGWVVRVSQREWDHTRRPLAEIAPHGVTLPPEMIELAEWIAQYYFCPTAQAIEAMAPAALRAPKTRRVTMLRLKTDGVLPADLSALSAKRRTVVVALSDGPLERGAVLEQTGVSGATLRALVSEGWVESSVVRILVPHEATQVMPDKPTAAQEDDYTLTGAQQRALDQILAAATEPDLRVVTLFGVPGSGKTEVYVRAIRAIVARGRQAILLAPEIALATQIVERLARRFSRVAVIHSRMTPSQRRDAWLRAASGDVDVVIGTRAAVFAPLPRLGLLVIDEEQDTSYKNLKSPLYHARDVAIKRAQQLGAAVVLGSGTPSLETWHNVATLPHYTLSRIDERVPGAELPRARIVGHDYERTGQLLALETQEALRGVVGSGAQAILLHNRRGYATWLKCATCGLIARCDRCQSPMVWHRAENQIICHRCERRMPTPIACFDDSCGGMFEKAGLAIERVEEEVRRVVTNARVLRLDSDTMHTRADYADALRAFADGAADVMIGTQMIAKGLDFPRVALVCVVDADAGLWLADFRAAEYAFQMVTQVIGRAGRKQGESTAIIQCADPRSTVMAQAAALDYEAFARDELRLRESLRQPPFTRLVRFVLSGEKPGPTRREAEGLAEGLARVAARVDAAIRVEPAESCVAARVRGLWRWQVMARCPRCVAQRMLLAADGEKALKTRVKRLRIDVDPVDMS